MRYLLDTQILLWFFNQSPKLESEIFQVLVAAKEGEVAISIASLWELTLKVSAQKLKLPVSLSALFQLVETSGIVVLPLTPQVLLEVQALPLHHRDPFDRAILATTKLHGLRLISSDTQFKAYSEVNLWQNEY
jgi:PIN domain nuclease of toxin-antitoxin system